MPTATTIPLLLLFAFLWRFTKGQLLSIVVFTSVFSAASALNIGAMGVSPWLFVLAIGLLIKLVHGHRSYHLTPGVNRLSLHLIVLFLGYALFAGLVYPVLFHGVPVVRTIAQEPLSWGMSNFAQLCYLGAASLLYFITVSRPREELQNAVDWYVRGCVVASLFAIYQLLHATAHIPYPDAVLYSNPSYVIYGAYRINGIWRLNATFCEASEMAGYLVVALGLVGWKLITLPFCFSRMFTFVLIVSCLLMTISSVGYACLAYVLVSGMLLCITQVLRQNGLTIIKAACGLGLVLSLTVAYIANPELGQTVNKVITSTLLEKKTSDSYRNRTLTHVAALETLSKTYYMGAGWGSIRASGLLYVLLGTLGLPGVALFVAFLLSLFVPLFGSARRRIRGHPHDLFEQSLFAITILLLAMIIAGAEPVAPVLWILFGVATVARVPVSRLVPLLKAAQPVAPAGALLSTIAFS